MAVWMKENSVDDLDLPFSLDAINPWTGGLVTVNLDDDDDKMLNDANKVCLPDKIMQNTV